MKGQNVMVRGTLCALLGGVCWGFSGTMGQYLFAQKGLETAWVTTVRMLLAGVLLLGVMAARQPRETVRVWTVGKDARRLILFAALGLIPCQFTYLECIAYSNSATGTALNYLGQMMVLFYVCLITRRLPTRWEITALLLAMAGVFFLATHGNIHTLVLSPQALFWGLLGAAMVVVYSAPPVAGGLRQPRHHWLGDVGGRRAPVFPLPVLAAAGYPRLGDRGWGPAHRCGGHGHGLHPLPAGGAGHWASEDLSALLRRAGHSGDSYLPVAEDPSGPPGFCGHGPDSGDGGVSFAAWQVGFGEHLPPKDVTWLLVAFWPTASRALWEARKLRLVPSWVNRAAAWTN